MIDTGKRCLGGAIDSDIIYSNIFLGFYLNTILANNCQLNLTVPPEVIRRIIYTTNAIEGLNSQLRKVTNNKRFFPSDDSVFKTLYLTIGYITTKCNMPIQN